MNAHTTSSRTAPTSLLHLALGALCLPHIVSAGSVQANVPLWPNARIPYDMNGVVGELAILIGKVFRDWEWATCIRFAPKAQNDPIFIKITTEGDYCRVGARGYQTPQVPGPSPAPGAEVEANPVNIGTKCTARNIINYLIGEVIGMVPEHRRPDRDKFIKVLLDGIDEAHKPLFEIKDDIDTSNDYDLTSIMHWPATSEHMGPGFTLQSLDPGKPINPGDRGSPGDFAAVAKAYQCPPEFLRATTAPLTPPVSSDGDHSHYHFMIDAATEEYMHNNQFSVIGVHQHCDSNKHDMDTDNWAFTPLAGSGVGHRYEVTVDRCKKDHDRHVQFYQLFLCRSNSENDCPYSCDQRQITPVDTSGNVIESKTVDLTDNWIWVCHGLPGAE